MEDLVVLEKPSSPQLPDLLRKAVREGRLVIVIGECSVEYEGRGASRLGSGERILVIKQDGSVLLHRPTGYSPINWQPSSSTIEVWSSDDTALRVLSVRSKPREVLDVSFTRVDLVVIAGLKDKAEYTMYLDEAEMKSIIVRHPEIVEPGFRVVEDEKKLEAGQADIYGLDKNGNPVIVELKRVTASREAVLQLYSYVESYESKYGRRPRGILVAPSFSPSALEALHRLKLEYKRVDPRELYKLAVEKGLKKSLFKYTRRRGLGESGG
ncbi:MAG: endonuclease NucS [Desulfurococcus sp.]|nr:endonuclease NucS [Desulfurococcus sp.]